MAGRRFESVRRICCVSRAQTRVIRGGMYQGGGRHLQCPRGGFDSHPFHQILKVNKMIDVRIDKETHERLLEIDDVSIKELNEDLWWVYYEGNPIGNKVDYNFGTVYSLSKYSPLREQLGLSYIERDV